MADKTLRSITFPGLTGRYVIPEPDVSADQWYDPDLWVEGHLNSGAGAVSTTTTYNRMCTPELIPANVTRIKVQDGYKIIPYCWSADGSTYLGIWNGSAPVKAWSESNWLTGTVDLKAISTAYRFKILAQQASGSRQLVPATDADKFVFVSFTDKTLTIGGKAADAKATGDRFAAVDAELDEISERFDTKAPVIVGEASGSAASFGDGADGLPMKSLVATIEPVQDLHGFDHPWPAGGGKNLLIQNLQIIKAANPDGTWNENVYSYGGLTFTVNADNAGNIKSIGISGTVNSSDVFFYFVRVTYGFTINAGSYICSGYGSSYKMRIGKGTSDTFVAGVAPNGSFTLDEDSICSVALRFQNMSGTAINETVYPMIRLSSVSDATFEPYSNSCPITGWTGLSGKRAGKNLLKKPAPTTRTTNGVTFTVDSEGIVTANGTNTGTPSYLTIFINSNNIKPGNYYFYAGLTDGVNGTKDVFIWDNTINSRAKQWDGITNVESAVSNRLYQVQILDGHEYVYDCRITNGITVTDCKFYPMICLADMADATFEPYIATDIAANWQSQAGEVYHGTLDIISGKFVVDHAKMIVDGNRTLYNLMARTNTVRFAVAASPTMSRVVRAAIPVKSDILPTSTSFDFYNSDKLGVCGWTSTENENPGLWMSIPIEAGSTDESVKAWLNANPITCVYPIASPVEYQLTPQEVTTLLGNNVVYTDVGVVTVDYPADTGIVVSQQKNAISQLEEKVDDIYDDYSAALVALGVI